VKVINNKQIKRSIKGLKIKINFIIF
jgi:hypothetical protein